MRSNALQTLSIPSQAMPQMHNSGLIYLTLFVMIIDSTNEKTFVDIPIDNE